MKRFLILLIFIVFCSCKSQSQYPNTILPGAYQMEQYLPLLEDKKVGLFVNHTSLIQHTHLTDSLLALGINVSTVFSPEHGFKGNLSDGELIEKEANTRPFELISLYGSSKKPTEDQINTIDILVVDIQDVGVRCYTYASTMTYLMEACAKSQIPVLLLDRPNPNGSYVDGPVLQKEHASIVGLHPIPLVHGLTLGELAVMINEQRWLEDRIKCDLQVIKIKNWDHQTPYSLPVRPSPNLPNDLAVSLYPSLVLFEGTVVSVGRGTDTPFQVLGHPDYPDTAFTFTPKPNEGSRYPPLEGELCRGVSLASLSSKQELTLKHLLDFHEKLKGSTHPFFKKYFTKLAGTTTLQKQIEAGLTEDEISASWQESLDVYKAMRKGYLLYQ